MEKSTLLLVGTSHFLGLVNTKTGKIVTLSRDFGLYYGITWDMNYIYVAARCSLFTPAISTPTMGEFGHPKLLVFDKGYKLIGMQAFPVSARDLHQIMFFDNRLICSCSGDDSYIIKNGSRWGIWYPSSNKNHHGTDIHHFNSILCEPNTIYIACHNRGPSEIWEFKYPEKKFVDSFSVGRCIHNIWREKEDLIFCNSGEGTIETTGGEILCQTEGFPRGAAITPFGNYIGISDIVNRDNRADTSGWINVYNKDWGLEKRIDLGKCGQVNELRCINDYDWAHNGSKHLLG